jgi:peptide/nickel transport system substrate-binding protein
VITVSSHVRRVSSILLVGLLAGACVSTPPSPTPTSQPTTPPATSPTPSGQPSGTPTPTDGATPTTQPTVTLPPSGGTVRIGIGGFPDSRNPGVGELTESYTLYELVYETPITQDAAGDYVPELATDWSVSDDGLTWTLTIRDDVTFHDGTPLTAEDVRFSIQLYQDTEAFIYLPSYTEGFTAVEAPDATTLTITTAEPVGNFESRMAFMYVLPKHVWENVEDPVAFQNEEMIGSGPFRLTNFDQGVSTTLEAVKDHWQRPPHIDRVIFQTIGNSDARVTALQRGEVDMITEFPATAVPALRNAQNVELLIAEPLTGSLTDIFFNVVDPDNCPEDGGVCSGHPALRDVEVRRALAEATDKQQLIDVALLGLGSPGLSLVPTGLGDFYASGVQDYAFSIDAANARLDAAGYTDTDGDGIRECRADQECPTGDLTFRFYYNNDSDIAPREADLISDMWEQVGVALQIQGLDPSGALTTACCPAFDYDVIRWGWGSDPDPAFLLGVVICDEVDTGTSETGYCNPAYDELYQQQLVETDHAERVRIIHQMQQILIDDVPYIIPYYDKVTQAFRTDTFVGWPTTDPTLGLESAESLTTISRAP